MGLLDILFPKYCVSCKKLGSYLCDNCFARLSFSQKTMCFVCGKSAIDGITHPNCLKKDSINGCFIAYEYSGPVKKLLYVLKYKPYVTDIAHLLGVLFFEAIIQKEQVMHLLETEKDTVLVPISLHTKKLRQRGYNHAKLLADQIGKRLSLPIVDCLLRSKETKIQAGLTKKEREANMKDAFSVKSVDIKNKTIFLVDDIVTTGVTFGEAAKVLKKNGAKAVYGLAFSGEN